ncbi:MAG TPA: hypothetical protein VJ124_22950 [Pyrinomonadaceae bacterium]|nr:hypothetical protein [Pyrinomonadaceae bacterium]
MLKLWAIVAAAQTKPLVIKPIKFLIVGKPLIATVVLGCLGLLLVYPFESTVVPEWNVRIIDESGNPVRNLSITQGWADYSLQSKRAEETRRTDSQGHVYFPRRVVRAPMVVRLAGPALSSLNPHGQSGPRAFLNVVGPYLTSADTEYLPGKELPKIIVVRPQP